MFETSEALRILFGKDPKKMTVNIENYLIVYMSPAGTTRQTARMAQKALEERGCDVSLIDLAEHTDWNAVYSRIQKGKDKVCLFIGSPVYVSHAVPPVTSFIAGLPENTGACAVPFVTWGCATSGVALYEMGEALLNKGMKLVGAAKVAALHCMMWKSENPLGKGRPDDSDEKTITEMVEKLTGKFRTGAGLEISLSDLAYLPENLFEELKKHNLEIMKPMMPPRTIDESKCNQCGMCVDSCPVLAVSLDPLPEFGKDCIYCYNCARACPEQAILVDLSVLVERIRTRSEKIAEKPPTQIFF